MIVCLCFFIFNLFFLRSRVSVQHIILMSMLLCIRLWTEEVWKWLRKHYCTCGKVTIWQVMVLYLLATRLILKENVRFHRSVSCIFYLYFSLFLAVVILMNIKYKTNYLNNWKLIYFVNIINSCINFFNFNKLIL